MSEAQPDPPPRFSVIIPTYNRGDLVSDTLRSVFDQTIDDYEVLVVDDGSTDDTLAAVRSFGPRVQVLEQAHAGCAAARNLGAQRATGQYLAFLDSDDLWFPWTLATFAEAIERSRRPAFVGGSLKSFRSEAELADVEQQPLRLTQGEDFLSTALPAGWGLGVAHGVVRRDDYLEAGGCPERNVNGTDTDILLKLGVAPGCAILHAPCTLAYRVHDGSTSFNFEKATAGLRMLYEHEHSGVYPGGAARQRERRANISGRVRGISRMALSFGRPAVAWSLYRMAFRDSVRAGRLKYLAAMPPFIVWKVLLQTIGLSTRGTLRVDI